MIKRRLTALALSFIVLTGLMYMPVSAEDISDNEGDGKQTLSGVIQAADYAELKAGVEGASGAESIVIELTEDIELEGALTVSGNVTIKGNGHVITRKPVSVSGKAEYNYSNALYPDGEGNYEMRPYSQSYTEAANYSAFSVGTGAVLYIQDTVLDGSASGWSYLKPDGEEWKTSLGYHDSWTAQGPIYQDSDGNPVHGYEFIPDENDLISTQPMIKVSGTLSLEGTVIRNVLASCEGAAVSGTGSSGEDRAVILLTDSQITHCASWNSGVAVSLVKNADMTLEGNTQLSGNYVFSSANHSLIKVYSGSTVNINEQTNIQDNYYHGNGLIGIYGSGSKVVFNGGEITGNRFVSALQTNNIAPVIYVHSSSAFEMNGGTLADNYVNAWGAVATNSSNQNASLNGGTIQNNLAPNGNEEGMYVQKNAEIGAGMTVHGEIDVVRGTLTNNGTIAGNVIVREGVLTNNGTIRGKVKVSGSGKLYVEKGGVMEDEDFLVAGVALKKTDGSMIIAATLENALQDLEEGDVVTFGGAETISCFSEVDAASFLPDGISVSGIVTDSQDGTVVTVTDSGKLLAENTGGTKIHANAEYNGISFTVEIKIAVAPRELRFTYTGTGSGSVTYPYSEEHQKLSDYMTFAWADDPDQKVELEEGTDISYTYTVGTEFGGTGSENTYPYLPMPVGSYKVTLNLENENYVLKLEDDSTSSNIEVQVVVQDAGASRVYLAGAEPSETEFTYDGEGKIPVKGELRAYRDEHSTAEPVDAVESFEVYVAGLNGTSFESNVTVNAGTDLSDLSEKGLKLPDMPGTYVITVSATGSDKEGLYYLYKSQVFTITKADPRGTPHFTHVSEEGKTLGEVELSLEGILLVGTEEVKGIVSWDEPETEIVQGQAYGWTFIPENKTCYNELRGTSVVWLNNASIEFADGSADMVYTGEPAEAPAVNSTQESSGEITFGWEKKDDSGNWTALESAPADAGSYRVTAYLGEDLVNGYGAARTQPMEFLILPKTLGEENVPEITEKTDLGKLVIKDGEKILKQGNDYTVVKEENDGNAVVTVTFMGNYTGKAVRTYKITSETPGQQKPADESHGGNQANNTDKGSDTPGTGDTSRPLLWAMLLALSLLCAGAVVRRRNK